VWVDGDLAAAWDGPGLVTATGAATESAIITRALRKEYGTVVALEGLDVEVPSASVGLLGANGSGKSTLIKCLLGLLAPTSGTASVLGYDIVLDPLRLREHVGYMPESDCLPLDVTASDFVSHMAEMSGMPSKAARQRANDVLYQVGVDEERYRLIRGFSTGMKQRVKLAQAIVHDPQLVFLDEPTNGMDPQGREDMLNLIRRIHRELGVSVVLSSHLLEDVEHVCDHVVMLDRGRLVVAGKIDDLMSGGSDVIVRVDGDTEAFISRLVAHGVRARLDGNEIVVTRASDGDETVFDVIRDTAVALDLPLRQLRARQRSLEDVYIQTVSGELAGVAGGDAGGR
jgi:ABC-2 type transport system ATP-binding protein